MWYWIKSELIIINIILCYLKNKTNINIIYMYLIFYVMLINKN